MIMMILQTADNDDDVNDADDVLNHAFTKE